MQASGKFIVQNCPTLFDLWSSSGQRIFRDLTLAHWWGKKKQLQNIDTGRSRVETHCQGINCRILAWDLLFSWFFQFLVLSPLASLTWMCLQEMQGQVQPSWELLHVFYLIVVGLQVVTKALILFSLCTILLLLCPQLCLPLKYQWLLLWILSSHATSLSPLQC